jgi:hypothetical protein
MRCVAAASTRPGGHDETPVGRLPTGPAGDAALAAAAAGRPASDARPSASRGAVVKRAVPVAAAAMAVAAAAVAVLRARRRR